jgi:hypothetical protein
MSLRIQVGDRVQSSGPVSLIRPLPPQYRATESSIVGSSPNRYFYFGSHGWYSLPFGSTLARQPDREDAGRTKLSAATGGGSTKGLATTGRPKTREREGCSHRWSGRGHITAYIYALVEGRDRQVEGSFGRILG